MEIRVGGRRSRTDSRRSGRLLLALLTILAQLALGGGATRAAALQEDGATLDLAYAVLTPRDFTDLDLQLGLHFAEHLSLDQLAEIQAEDDDLSAEEIAEAYAEHGWRQNYASFLARSASGSLDDADVIVVTGLTQYTDEDGAEWGYAEGPRGGAVTEQPAAEEIEDLEPGERAELPDGNGHIEMFEELRGLGDEATGFRLVIDDPETGSETLGLRIRDGDVVVSLVLFGLLDDAFVELDEEDVTTLGELIIERLEAARDQVGKTVKAAVPRLEGEGVGRLLFDWYATRDGQPIPYTGESDEAYEQRVANNEELGAIDRYIVIQALGDADSTSETIYHPDVFRFDDDDAAEDGFDNLADLDGFGQGWIDPELLDDFDDLGDESAAISVAWEGDEGMVGNIWVFIREGSDVARVMLQIPGEGDDVPADAAYELAGTAADCLAAGIYEEAAELPESMVELVAA